jgi:hypothetical protein
MKLVGPSYHDAIQGDHDDDPLFVARFEAGMPESIGADRVSP